MALYLQVKPINAFQSMVALLGDVDAGFGIILLIIFLFFLFRMIFSGGESYTPEGYNQMCRREYKNAIKNNQWELNYAIEKFNRLNKEDQELVLSFVCGSSKPYIAGKESFDGYEIQLLRGMWVEQMKIKSKRRKSSS